MPINNEMIPTKEKPANAVQVRKLLSDDSFVETN